MTGDPIYPQTTGPMLSAPDRGPITNADRIRAMSNEELAETFAQHMVDLVCRVASNFDCDIGAEKQFLLEKNKADWLQWLQSPAEGGAHDA